MAGVEPTEAALIGYLDEQLPADRMAEVEAALRRSESLRRRLAMLTRRRDQGEHSVGEIWRRRRVSCPSRADLGSFLLGVLEPEAADYVDFHIREVGCRYCAANLRDLEAAAAEQGEATTRRRRYFESSAGLLRRDDE